MKRLLVPAAVPAVLASVLFGAAATSAAPAPRRELGPEPLNVVESFDQRLVVKFRDDVRARSAADGTLVSAAERDLSPVIAAVGPSARFRPLIGLPESTLSALEGRAEARSGRAQPDLAGMLVVEVPGANKE
ncbi:MAG: hypothetical protein KC591_07800 [Gemmatimonadetes bacterium]|nr:hypothetical protein [Gemmatimonadota bacterium]